MHKYGELLGSLLVKRGLTNVVEAEKFLYPDYRRDLHDPFLFSHMERACVRIFEAITNKEKIIIFADYDCDGIPGAVIFTDLFKLLRYENYEVYIPHRHTEGYGLNGEALKKFAASQAKLLITVDLGITAVSEINQAEVLGIDVIVTDHHLPPEKLPRAYAILNPKVDEYPNKMLCGAGVVFKLIQGFLKKYREYFGVKEGTEKWLLDMVGLATLADMVPLLGENRALAYFGMKVLRKSSRPGLQKLLAKLNIDQRFLTEDDINFMIIPRLNAASRMGDPFRAFELLATEDEAQAGALVDYLSRVNDERKNLVINIMREVNKKLDRRHQRDVIVIGSPAWRTGVLGLIAGKLVDQYEKPVFVWGEDETGAIRGSCRSDGSVSVVKLMDQVKDFFIEFGGHELAGGFTVDREQIHFLEEALAAACVKLRAKESHDLGVDYKHDTTLSLEAVTVANWQELEKLSPFGLGNEKPVFLFESTKVEKIKKFGKNGGEHLEIIFSDGNGAKAKAVSFFSDLDSFSAALVEGGRVNLLANLDLSRFRGREEIRLRVVNVI